MTYQYAAGFNNAAGLTTLTPQPSSTGIRPARVTVPGNRIKRADGYLLTEWVWGDTISEESLNTIFTALGLSAVTFTTFAKECTVRTRRNSDRAFANYNAVIALPDRLRYSMDGWWSGVTFELTLIAAL